MPSDRVKVVICVQWSEDFDPDDRINPNAVVVVNEIATKFLSRKTVIHTERIVAAAAKAALDAWIAKELQ